MDPDTSVALASFLTHVADSCHALAEGLRRAADENSGRHVLVDVLEEDLGLRESGLREAATAANTLATLCRHTRDDVINTYLGRRAFSDLRSRSPQTY